MANTNQASAKAESHRQSLNLSVFAGRIATAIASVIAKVIAAGSTGKAHDPLSAKGSTRALTRFKNHLANSLAIRLVFVVFLLACQPQNGKRDQHLNTGTPTAQPATPSMPAQPGSPNTFDGTVDAGGGNTINGSPIEDCRYEVETDPAFEKYLQPLLEHLDREAPIVGRVIRSGYKNKNWYVVPTALPQIERARVGLVFNSEQTALTNFREVFLSQKIFSHPFSVGLVAETASCLTLKQALQKKFSVNKFTRASESLLRARAVLIFHELLMSFRLLKFDSVFRDCLAQANNPAHCVGASTATRGRPADLTFEDHQQVRSLTALWLRTAQQKNSYALFKDLYFAQFTLNGHDFEADSHPHQEISNDQFLDRLRISKSLESWPTKGVFKRVDIEQLQNFNGQMMPCSLDVNHEQQSLRLDIGGVTHALILPFESPVFAKNPINRLSLWQSNGYESLRITSLGKTSLGVTSSGLTSQSAAPFHSPPTSSSATQPPSEADAHWDWVFTFENNLLKMVRVTKMLCAKSGSSTFCSNARNQSETIRSSVTCF